MPKNIVLCSDGTGNRGGKMRATNVWRIFKAVDATTNTDEVEPKQIAFHDDGVGTEGNKVMRLLGGAIGHGLSANVRQLYESLCRVYEPGDNIYLFGFSRGAYTIRIVGGIIARFGVIDPHKCGTLLLSEAIHRAHRLTLQARPSPNKANAIKKLVHGDSRHIRFIGVWDTVDAVGFPIDIVADIWNRLIYRFRFSNRRLDPCVVDKACHVLSIDDQRRTFEPVMWDQTNPATGKPADWIEQIWFAGVHANVGGGYPKDELAHISLIWMMDRAADHDLRYDADLRKEFNRECSTHGKLYNSRAGMAWFYRYKPRHIESLCARNGIDARFHDSALYRLHTGATDYAPVNLPAEYIVGPPHAPDIEEVHPVERFAAQQSAADFVFLRRLTNSVFVTSVVTLVAAGLLYLATLEWNFWTGYMQFVDQLAAEELAGIPTAVVVLMGWFALLWAVSRHAKRQIRSKIRAAWAIAFERTGGAPDEGNTAPGLLRWLRTRPWLNEPLYKLERWLEGQDRLSEDEEPCEGKGANQDEPDETDQALPPARAAE